MRIGLFGVIIAVIFILFCATREPARAQTVCDADSFERIVPSYRAAEAIPLSPANILQRDLNPPRVQAVNDLPYVRRCYDDPPAIQESYVHLATWWANAIQAQTEYAQVLAVKQGLTINSPKCATYYAAYARVLLRSGYAVWRNMSLSSAAMPLMEQYPEFAHVQRLWKQTADKLHYKLEAIGSPSDGGVALNVARTEAYRRLPQGVYCGVDMAKARRGVLEAIQQPSPNVATASKPAVTVPVATNVRATPVVAKPAVRPTLVVTNAWNDSINGVLYVHDAIALTGAAEPTAVSASNFQLTMELSSGLTSAYTGLVQAAPSYQKLSLSTNTEQMTPEVDPMQDLGRIGILRVPENQTILTVVTFVVPDPVKDPRMNRTVSIK